MAFFWGKTKQVWFLTPAENMVSTQCFPAGKIEQQFNELSSFHSMSEERRGGC